MLRPTPRGLGFGIILLSLYFFAGQTQIGWLYVMVAGGLGWLLLSLVYPLWALRGVWIDRRIVPPAGGPPVEDEPLRVELSLGHLGRTVHRFLRVIEQCPVDPPGRAPRSFVIDRLPPERDTRFEYETLCYLRGRYTWPPVRVESSGPLGFFRAVSWFDTTDTVTVLPPVWEVGASLGGLHREPSPARRPQRGTGLDLLGTRPYQHGDPIHHIHWRSTARHRELVVREHEEPRRPDVVIWIDNGASFGAGRESTLEYAVKLAATLGAWAIRSGCTVTLVERDRVTRCQTPLVLRRTLARLELTDTATWPWCSDAQRAVATIVLRAEGGPGTLPDAPTGPVRLLVRLAGFPGQPAAPVGAAGVAIGPGSDLRGEAATLAHRIAEADTPAGLRAGPP